MKILSNKLLTWFFKFRQLLKLNIYRQPILAKIYFDFVYKASDGVEKFLDEYLKPKANQQPKFFLQIGSNDGVWGDSLGKFVRKYKVPGILVEPQPSIFKKLLKNYSNYQGLVFVNAAIDNKSGFKDFYHLSFNDYDFASGLSSFVKNDIQKMIDVGYLDRMAEERGIVLPKNKAEWIKSHKLKTVSIYDLCIEYKIDDLSLIVIDAEGYDFEIIKSIPFSFVKPGAIIYENTHLSNQLKKECENFLSTHNYSVSVEGSETVALLKK